MCYLKVVESKKASIEMETVVRLILFLLSVIVVFSIFKLVVSKVFTNIGLEMCSISFSLEKSSQDASWKDLGKKTSNLLLSKIVSLGCSPAKERVKINSKEDLLIDLLFKFKKICDLTGKGTLDKEKVELLILKVNSKNNIEISNIDLMRLRDAKLLTPNGKIMDITLGDYCNNLLITPSSEKEKDLVIKKDEKKIITLYYEKNEDNFPKIYVEY